MGSAGEKIKGLEFKTIESFQTEAKRLLKKEKKRRNRVSVTIGIISDSIIHVIRAPGIEEREIKKEKILEEIMANLSFPNLSNTSLPQKAPRTSSRINTGSL